MISPERLTGTRPEHPAEHARLGVGSEVGVLRRVVLHRPDLELERLTPRNKDALLFDDVLWVRRARQEHDAFADALASAASRCSTCRSCSRRRSGPDGAPRCSPRTLGDAARSPARQRVLDWLGRYRRRSPQR